jgi:hypothetical protein
MGPHMTRKKILRKIDRALAVYLPRPIASDR